MRLHLLVKSMYFANLDPKWGIPLNDPKQITLLWSRDYLKMGLCHFLFLFWGLRDKYGYEKVKGYVGSKVDK